MRDVLANSTERAENEGAHDTSMGTHNLSMIGDMPVAHSNMMDHLDALDSAMNVGEGSAHRRFVTDWSIAVAEEAGATLAQRTLRSAIAILCAVRAACQCLRRGRPSIAHAAAANGCTRRQCKTWLLAIERRIRKEAASAARAADSSESPTDARRLKGRHKGEASAAQQAKQAAWRDALRAADDTAQRAKRNGQSRHATSKGTHNLAMSGDMPIAHPDTRSLLAFLNMALDGNARALLIVIERNLNSTKVYMSCSRKVSSVAAFCVWIRSFAIAMRPFHKMLLCLDGRLLCLRAGLQPRAVSPIAASVLR
jgi:hypothetical protein